MPDQIGWFFHDSGGAWIDAEGTAVGLFLGIQTRGCREEGVHDDTERCAFTRFNDTIYGAGKVAFL
jgi:hypothetical protein